MHWSQNLQYYVTNKAGLQSDTLHSHKQRFILALPETAFFIIHLPSPVVKLIPFSEVLCSLAPTACEINKPATWFLNQRALKHTTNCPNVPRTAFADFDNLQHCAFIFCRPNCKVGRNYGRDHLLRSGFSQIDS